MVRELESEESRRLLLTLSRAVSVLWWIRKPDWNVSYRLLERRYCLSCVATALSSSFERNVRLEMGLKLLGSSGSRPGFLRRGVMAGSLRGGGTVPEFREELMMSVMSGVREVKQALTSTEGMGSRGEVEDFMVESIFERSSVVLGEKMESRWSGVEGSGGSESRLVEEEVASWLWMISILEWKNYRKLLHFSGVNEDEMLSWC